MTDTQNQQGYEVQEHIWNDILLIECLAEHIRLGLNDGTPLKFAS